MERVRKAVNAIAYTEHEHLAKLSPLQLSLIPVLFFASSLYKAALSLRRSLYHFGLFRKHRWLQSSITVLEVDFTRLTSINPKAIFQILLHFLFVFWDIWCKPIQVWIFLGWVSGLMWLFIYPFVYLSYKRYWIERLPVPVISVGNLTWGGNGKTPMVEFIARYLADSGISPLILTRVTLIFSPCQGVHLFICLYGFFFMSIWIVNEGSTVVPLVDLGYWCNVSGRVMPVGMKLKCFIGIFLEGLWRLVSVLNEQLLLLSFSKYMVSLIRALVTTLRKWGVLLVQKKLEP